MVGVSDDTWDDGLADRFADEAYASVLDAGAGHQSFPLAQAGYNVTLLDSSAAVLARARTRLERLPAEVQDRVAFVHAAGEDAAGRFDAVLCHGVLGYLDSPDPLVAQLYACVAPRRAGVDHDRQRRQRLLEFLTEDEIRERDHLLQVQKGRS